VGLSVGYSVGLCQDQRSERASASQLVKHSPPWAPRSGRQLGLPWAPRSGSPWGTAGREAAIRNRMWKGPFICVVCLTSVGLAVGSSVGEDVGAAVG
jgi:hypothetical protein